MQAKYVGSVLNFKMLLAIVGLLFVVPRCVLAQEPEVASEDSWLWVSRAENLRALSNEMAKLYLALWKADSLPELPVPNDEGKTVLELLRERKLHFGIGFPKQIDAILCSMNEADCRRVVNRSGEIDFKWTNQAHKDVVLPDLAFEVVYGKILYEKNRGQRFSDIVTRKLGGCQKFDDECRERISDMNGDGPEVLHENYEGPVWLPTLKLRTRLKLPEDKDLLNELAPNLVPRATAVIPIHRSKKEMLASPIIKLNDDVFQLSPLSFEAEYNDIFEIVLRENSLGDRLSISGEEKDLLDARIGLTWTNRITDRMSRASNAQNYVTSVPVDIEILSPIVPLTTARCDECITAIRSNELSGARSSDVDVELVIPLASGDSDAATAETYDDPGKERKLAASQRLIFDLISAPLPGELDLPYEPLVVVIDTFVDEGHCAFGGRVTSDNLDNKIDDSHRVRCGAPAAMNEDERGNYMTSEEHGTHVTSLIVASEYPEQGETRFRGLNPFAEVKTFQVRINLHDFDVEAATKRLLRATKKIPKVMNFSFGYLLKEGDGKYYDTFAAELEKIKKHTLVVAAAGNFGKIHEGPCDLLPACLDLPNIIAVAALDLSKDNPQLLEDSDRGMGVHIAAPALDVPSAFRANAIGELGGTSQAAPLVAATASLIFAQDPSLFPREVRNRLVYTSDLFPSLEGKILGGRLNVQQAIDFKDDIITLRAGAEVREYSQTVHLEADTTLRGRIERLGDAPDRLDDFNFLVYPHGATESEDTDFSRVRRMVATPNVIQGYTLFLDDNRGNLIRQRVSLDSGDRWIFMMVKGAESEPDRQVRFQMKYIRDYVSRID